ncbi:MAG TPA: ABC transporter ATP-binding protein, partial [Hyphomicrobiales bacterium]|nr:ABC transporter ATP-binding protein [Hyphomicrobiales bacterium]
GETQALFGVSLKVAHGEAVALLGANGAGKTTMLRSILGLTPPRSGEISFDGNAITRAPTHEISKLGIGWVPEERRIFPSLKVRTNLALGEKKSAFRNWTIGDCFALFSALEYLMDRDCENLSGGEMQMVAIARAMLGGPGLMLMDEPSQGLAPKLVQDVMKSVRAMKDEGVAVILVEQHAERALEVTDRVYVIDKGRIVHEGPSQALLDDAPLRHRLVGA